MEITEQFLLDRISGMEKQLQQAAAETDMLRGAIADCKQLIQYLHAKLGDEDEQAKKTTQL